ncbi:MAG: DDE-type integrase/transposase/recombinase [Verrucomicrobia bacterium]|nr:DDE-type integrase/transposase/recombinase [Verrucomicrobiota bacterium]
MTEKERFVTLARTGRFTITELCADFGISRKTGHKYLQRYDSEGRGGLGDRSRRPKGSPTATVEEVEKLILRERRKHPTWGAKKIHDLLLKVHGIENRPHINTVNNVLNRHGMTKKRKRRAGLHRVRPEHVTEPTRSNEVWTFDFKGWFTMGDGVRCEPLTVCDRYSRYLVGCRGQFNQQFNTTLRSCKKLMRYYGLPEIIRVDNGTPFGSVALGGLSQLSVWWIEQGVRVEFIRPASPQENGSHERMHKDLKAEVAHRPAPNMRAQQKRFDRWRQEYNHDRPHEALDMLRPAEVYRPSAKRLGEKDRIRYPRDYEVKRVSGSGHVSCRGSNFYMSEIYAGCRVGLFENSDGITELHYANLHLGNLEFNCRDAWRPKALVIAPDQEPRAARPK